MNPYNQVAFGAFYSSLIGGIVTDPALMMLPVDDQLFCKGHGITDCVVLRDGYLYLLDAHVERLKESCERVGMSLPFTEAAVKRIILDTAAASGKLNGVLRLWVTPGRGGFTTLEMGGGEPAMYVLALGDTYDIERTEAWDAIVAEQTILPTMTSSVLGNQHLLTTVFQLVAHEQDAQVAIFTDPEGFVQHCAGYMLCILTQMDVLVFPPSETTTPSLTLARLLELIPGEKERSPDDVIVSDVQQRQLHISEVLSAKECFLVGTTYTIAPVRSVDGQPIADNSTGLTTLALHYMLENDKQAPPAGVFSPLHTPVPYGFMTGMRSHLT